MMNTKQTTELPKPEDKFKELLLYVGHRCMKDPRYSTLKRNKILFYAEAMHFAVHGEPITGVEYRRYDLGPAPACYLSIKEQMERIGDAYEYKDPYGDQKQLLPLRVPDMDVFKATEVEIIDAVIASFWDKTGNELSLMSHGLKAWLLAADGEIIPYSAITIPNSPLDLTAAEQEYGRSVAARLTKVA